MEKVLEGKEGLAKMILPAMAVVGMAFAMIVIFYGVDELAAGAHDVFHDFRHIIGMACCH